MEIFELKYFLGVAETENIHRASEKLNISPASLSKAIRRLEDELQTTLFSREGRNIQITDHGKLFRKRAAEIVTLEETVRLELSGQKGSINVVISGPEILLSQMGLEVSERIKNKFPKCTFEYHARGDDEAVDQVDRGEAHLAIVTSDVSRYRGLTSKLIAEPEFKVVVGYDHPLAASAKAKKTIPVEAVLEFPFLCPNIPLFGSVKDMQSFDGWRDDRLPRQVGYRTSSLKLLEKLVVQGHAVSYLPDYYLKLLDVHVLRVSGCPYTCSQKFRLVAKNPKNRSWMSHLF